MTKFTIAEAAKAEGIRLFDLVRAVGQGKIEKIVEEGVIYIRQDALDNYLGRAQPREELPVAAPQLPAVAPVQASPEFMGAPVAQLPAAEPLAPHEPVVEEAAAKEIFAEEPVSEGPAVELPARKTLLDRMRDIFGLRLSYLLRKYGDAKLRYLLVNFGGAVGDEGLKAVVHRTADETLFQASHSELTDYGKKLLEAMTLVRTHFGEAPPIRYDLKRAPGNFLPPEIDTTYRKMMQEIDKKVKGEDDKKEEQERRAQTEREMPNFREIARLVLEDGYEKLKKEFPEDKVAFTAAILFDAVGEESTKILLGSDFYRNILRIGPAGLENYVQNLKTVQQAITAKYGEDVPDEYDLRYSPTRFAPDKITGTIRKIEQAGDRNEDVSQQLYTVEEICARTRLPEDVVQGLISEGHDVYVLEAMLKEGFDLQGPSPIMGARKVTRQHWERNASTAYTALGVSENSVKWREAEKLFRRIDLIVQATDHRKECFSMNSRWASATAGYPSLKQYLIHYLAPKRSE